MINSSKVKALQCYLHQKFMDWQFAFERAEMLRQLQRELLVSIGHELRSPLTQYIGSLDMILFDLCDSPEEVKQYLTQAKGSVSYLIKRLEEYTDLSSQHLLIQPLQRQTVDLIPVLQKAHQLTHLQAKDRGIIYPWTISSDPFWVEMDPDGLLQALLGIFYWSIQQLRHGTLILSLEKERTCIGIHTLGQAISPLPTHENLIWKVTQRLLQEMNSLVTLIDSSPTHFDLEIKISSV